MGNYMKINETDLVNGEGIRVSLFFSGCSHRCKNCFNQEAWDFNAGKLFTEETVDKIIELLNKPYIRGLSVLGGEPFDNYSDLITICKRVKQETNNKDIWIWTGYNFSDISDKEVLNFADVIVDGRFVEEEKDLSLAFRGSKNQQIWRKIDGFWTT